MADKVKVYRAVPDAFFMESVEENTDLSRLRYHGRGEAVYGRGRQVMSRSCHDGLISCMGENGRGIVLIRRKGEPARGYLWSLGGYYDRGVITEESFASRIKAESGLDVDPNSLRVLGHIRAMWKTTPYTAYKEEGLPEGTDDTGVLFYGLGEGKINLDKLHDTPLIVTPEMYTPSFRESLHPYIRMGMDRAIQLID